jgi:hypothetical protein
MKKFWEEIDAINIPAVVFSATQPPISADGKEFTEVADSAKIKQLYLIQYSYRIDDGKNYVKDFTADRYIDVINGIYTEAEVFALEAHIKDLYSALSNGWWLTAQNINQNLILDGVYDAAMKSSIQTTLDAYVSDNY